MIAFSLMKLILKYLSKESEFSLNLSQTMNYQQNSVDITLTIESVGQSRILVQICLG